VYKATRNTNEINTITNMCRSFVVKCLKIKEIYGGRSKVAREAEPQTL
jgi:hypothetical protein